jgi:hypothetical protein
MANFIDGYNLAMARVRALHKAKTGHERGAGAWLATQLGVTRQSIDNFGDRSSGFPRKHAKKLCKITGLSESDIWPGITLPVDLPTEIADEIIVQSRRRRRSPAEIVVELVRIGLKRESKK